MVKWVMLSINVGYPDNGRRRWGTARNFRPISKVPEMATF